MGDASSRVPRFYGDQVRPDLAGRRDSHDSAEGDADKDHGGKHVRVLTEATGCALDGSGLDPFLVSGPAQVPCRQVHGVPTAWLTVLLLRFDNGEVPHGHSIAPSVNGLHRAHTSSAARPQPAVPFQLDCAVVCLRVLTTPSRVSTANGVCCVSAVGHVAPRLPDCPTARPPNCFSQTDHPPPRPTHSASGPPLCLFEVNFRGPVCSRRALRAANHSAGL